MTKEPNQHDGLSAHALYDIHSKLFPAIIGNQELYNRFIKEPKKVLSEYFIDVPPNLNITAIEPEMDMAYLHVPSPFLQQRLDELNDQLTAKYGTSDEPYVLVEPQWWGLVFILSDQAAKDLSAGQGGLSAVVSSISALVAFLPPPTNGLALVGGLISAILGVGAAAAAVMNQGKGIYITALWPVITNPLCWIPTPR